MAKYAQIGNKFYTVGDDNFQEISANDIVGRTGTANVSIEQQIRNGDIEVLDPSRLSVRVGADVGDYDVFYDGSRYSLGGSGVSVKNIGEAQALGINPPSDLPQGQIGVNQDFNQYLQQTGQTYNPQVGFSGGNITQPQTYEQQQAALNAMIPAGTPGALQQQGIQAGTLDPTTGRPFDIVDEEMLNAGQLPGGIENMGNEDLSKLFESLNAPQGGPNLASLFSGVQDQAVTKAQQQSLAIQKQLNDFYSSFEAGQNKIEGQTIPMEFIQGQQAGLARQAQAKEAGLQRQAQLAKTELGFAEQNRKTALENSMRPLEFYKTFLDLKKTQAEINKLDAEANAPVQKKYAPGAIGEYEYAKENGYTGTFQQYQNEDANRKRPITNILNSGLDSKTATRVQTIAGQFDNEQVVKNYNVVSEGWQFAKNLDNNSTNPADDQGLIYAFAKAMDPNSVVREGEYATVQKYSQSWADSYKFSAIRVLANREFLTPQARQQLKATIEARFKASEANYKNVYNEYGRRINKTTGQSDGTEYITDYSKAYSPGNNTVDKNTIQSDIYNAIKDPQHFPTREALIQAIMQHYGITQDEAAKKVYSVWTDNTPR